MPPRADLLIAAAWLVGGLGLAVVEEYNQPARPSLLLLGPLALIAASTALRRVAPVAMLVVGTGAVGADFALGGPSLSTILVYTQVITDAALHGPRWLPRFLMRATALLTAAVTVVAVVWLREVQAVLLGVLAGLVTFAPALTGVAIRQHRDRADAERRRADQVARLAELDHRAAVDAERHRMARELHDLVANHLSAIALRSTAALAGGAVDDGRMSEALRAIRESSIAGMGEMRTMVKLLRDASDGAAPDEATMPRLSGIAPLLAHARSFGLTARLHIAGEPRPLSTGVELASYRIVQESLTNAGRHGGAGTVDVTIAYLDRGVTVTVDNLPTGRPPALPTEPGHGAGLVGMTERAALLGGTLAAGPYGTGWRVRAELPDDPDRPITGPEVS